MSEASNNNFSKSQRLSEAQKFKNDREWFKSQLNLLDSKSFGNNGSQSFGEVSDYKRKKVNYDLYNNIVNIKDFEYVCKPFGSEQGELPAEMTNRDICSTNINVLLGMEMKRPFPWKIVATNEEATTRKEQTAYGLIKDFVVREAMLPIRKEIEKKYQEEQKGKDLSPDEINQLNAQMEEEIQAMTPEEVMRYMERDHQDPAEALHHQILQYLIPKQDVKMKFNKGFKHALIGGEEIYWVGIVNGEPSMRVVNPIYFDYDKSPDSDYIEEGEWWTYELRLTPSEIINNFGSELKNDQIDSLYEQYPFGTADAVDETFTFTLNEEEDSNTIRVLHGVWKSLRKIGFLTFFDKNNEEQMRVVHEGYQLNRDAGDIKINWEWIPWLYEGYKITGIDAYVNTGPVPGQAVDLDNLYNRTGPFIGKAYDNLNSQTTSFMDRMKPYQYYYNIIMYRLELLMASDKGKILLMNMNMIPRSQGIDIETWQYYLESMKLGYMNPAEEGNRGGADIATAAKEIDMSLASDIQKYISLAEYIERKCGESIGIPPEMQGQSGPNEAVGTVKQQITQSSHMVEPYFEMHNNVKRNALRYLMEVAKYAFSTGNPKKLSYILDDMSMKLLTVDQGLLDASTVGLFVSNSMKAHEAKDLIEQLAHAAMQNQKADLSDIIKIIRSEGLQESEEMLITSEKRKREEARQDSIAKEKVMAEEAEKDRIFRKEEMEHEANMIVLKEEEKRKTEIQKQTIMSMGFNENKDVDKDGKPDILEVAQHNVDANIKSRKQDLDENKFKHDKKKDEVELKLKKEELAEKKKENKKKK